MNFVKILLPKVVFLLGISIFFYPTFSDWWNMGRQSAVISRYEKQLEVLDKEEQRQILKQAREYNESLGEGGFFVLLTEEERKNYRNHLSMNQDGMMGYIEIPSIQCRLPIYHGTEESVLQKGAGHMENSSLPVGGSASHCVLSGHRGLPSARLFTGLDQLKQGDRFRIRVLNEEFYYEIYRVQTVLPEDTDVLKIEEKQDLCTLVTCTPYGINTHRLMVSGKRVEGTDLRNPGEETEKEDRTNGGFGMKGKDIIKWSVLFLLIIGFWISSFQETRAASTSVISMKEGFYEIRIEYPYADVEFELYEMSVKEESGVLIQRQKTDEKGIALFQNLKKGNYLVIGMEHEKNGYLYLPASSKVNLPQSEEVDVHQVIVRPKYEELTPSKTEEIPDTTESEEKEETTEEPKEENVLPQTGQQWILVWIFILIGAVFLFIALHLFFC